AVLISCLFIAEKEYRGRGLGKLLLESIIEDLRKRGFKAVETFARRNNSNNPSGPVEFYLKNGFRVLREDPEFPLMRLEL
ncbi:MAG: GNAT family N-acetyltransferase, partial [Thermoproteota archaeon]